MKAKENQGGVRVYHTTYDGFYLLAFDNDEVIYTYEGLCHCPNGEHKKLIEEALKNGTVKEVNESWYHAISYGYVR